MVKQINNEWMHEVLNNRNDSNEYSGDLPAIDWIQNGKSYKKEIKFKLLPANSKENQVFSYVVGTHWLAPDGLGEGKNRRFVCPEQTAHLKNLGIKCPVCEAKRRLLAKGYTEEQLSTQGKFGLIPLFDPTMTSNVKIVVMDTDLTHSWDKAHVSLLQQKGTFLTKWLVERYIDSDTPDFLMWENSNIIQFKRDSENGRWDRSISFATFNPTPEVLEHLKEENEALTLPDLWKQPTDQEVLEITQLMENAIKNFDAAKEALDKNTQVQDDDSIPF